jgi:flagellar biosynthesis/type III secretory pathway protein FliH
VDPIGRGTSLRRVALSDRTLRFEPPTLAAPARRTAADEHTAALTAAIDAARAETLAATRAEVEAAIARHDEAARRLDLATASLRSVASDLLERELRVADDVADATVEFALRIAEEVIGREVRSCDDLVVDAVRRAARVAPDRGEMVVRVHPDELATVAAALTAVDELAGRATVVPDHTVAPGGSAIVVGPLRIDARATDAIGRVRSALGH